MTRSAYYLPAVDGLRAISVLAVIGFHAAITNLGGGFFGVEVFFVISGFLIIALSLTEQAATARIGATANRRLRRAVRPGVAEDIHPSE